MKKIYVATAVLTFALVLAALPVRAQDTKPTEKKAEQKATPAAPAGTRESILFQIDEASKKLMSLAEAMPAEKYTWRPGEGVRSVGEVYNHVAAANYFLPTFWGGKVPAGVDPRTLEKDGGDKAKTIDTLKKSFDSLRQEIQAVPEADLGRKIKMFGQDATVRDAMMVLSSHAHEHLGQSIAYARMNGVVPPWSAQGGQ